MPGRVAFVPLRYGPQIVGGSEALTREIAIGLSRRGWDVEVLTTRVINHQAMADELPEGTATEDGLTVRRFSNVPHWSRPGYRAQQLVQDGTIPPSDDQWTWVSWRFSLPDLFHYLLRHGHEYQAVVFSPYMFWNTTACLSAVAGNAVVMPCLHDEPYARMSVMRPVLSDPASVWFLSEPEHDLAHRLGPVAARHTVTGAGMHVPGSYDPEGFRRRYRIERPFVLYAGRRERDKGWSWLLDTFRAAVASGLDGVDLVTFGSGDAEIPDGLRTRVIDLGFVSDTDRNDALAAALAYVQPSRMESFSRTVMEAWLAGIPVLAIDGSEVVDWHCRRSGGGLVFAGATELAAHITALRDDPARAAEMAAQGREYVLREYAWPVVLNRIEADLEQFRVSGTGSRPAAGSGPVETMPGPGPAAGSGSAGTMPGSGPGPAAGSGPAGMMPGSGSGPAAGSPAGASSPGGAPTGAAGPVLVVGSYPPIPVPGAPATVTEVRRVWAGERDVVVVSPRLSAAHLAVPVAGVLAGRRLVNVARVTGCRNLVLVAERGFPFIGRSKTEDLVTAELLVRALRHFDWVRLVTVGADAVPPAALARLRPAVHERSTAEPGPAAIGVTVLGPAEVRPSEQPRRLAGLVARRLLGSRAPAVRARLAAARRRMLSRGT